MNGQVEALNKSIVVELKRRLEEAKIAWVDELSEVLWAYRCSLHGTMGETPFNLTYGINFMFPVEVSEPSLKRQVNGISLNDAQPRVKLDNLREEKEVGIVEVETYKRMITQRYNIKIRLRNFNEEVLF